MTVKIGAVILSRMDSTRLPGKALIEKQRRKVNEAIMSGKADFGRDFRREIT